MNDSELLFVAMVAVAVASPGPGVLMTLDNAIASGWRSSMQGVIGLALGAAIMGGLSSAGVGLLVHSSPPLFIALQYCGGLYLAYLAYKAWHRPPVTLSCDVSDRPAHHRGLLLRGALLQTSNPKSLLFFLSVLPQFIESRDAATWPMARAITAIGIYCIALLMIHAVYAGAATHARGWLMKPSPARLLSRISALMYLGLGVAMLIPGR